MISLISNSNLIFVKDFEHEAGKVGGIALWEELFVDFLETLDLNKDILDIGVWVTYRLR